MEKKKNAIKYLNETKYKKINQNKLKLYHKNREALR